MHNYHSSITTISDQQAEKTPISLNRRFPTPSGSGSGPSGSGSEPSGSGSKQSENCIIILFVSSINSFVLYFIVPDLHCYVSSLPASVRPYLELQLDTGHEGVEKDLYEIANDMLNWEEISTHLRLTATDVSDIKEMNLNKPALQR